MKYSLLSSTAEGILPVVWTLNYESVFVGPFQSVGLYLGSYRSSPIHFIADFLFCEAWWSPGSRLFAMKSKTASIARISRAHGEDLEVQSKEKFTLLESNWEVQLPQHPFTLSSPLLFSTSNLSLAKAHIWIIMKKIDSSELNWNLLKRIESPCVNQSCQPSTYFLPVQILEGCRMQILGRTYTPPQIRSSSNPRAWGMNLTTGKQITTTIPPHLDFSRSQRFQILTSFLKHHHCKLSSSPPHKLPLI